MKNDKADAWRTWAAAAVVVIVVIAIFSWSENQEPTPAPIAVPAAPAPPTPVPRPLPALDRATLIDTAALAASAFAAGEATDTLAASLAGRRFRLILPFGCSGADTRAGGLRTGWRIDAAGSTLRVTVTPDLFAASADEDGLAAPAAREGFWIDRPWLRDPVCPALAQSDDMISGRKELAIVRLTDDDAPRRGRAVGSVYRLSVRIDPASVPDADGLRLLIEGRFEAGDASPLACAAESAQQRPICIFAARFQRIAVTDAGGATIYGEWTE